MLSQSRVCRRRANQAAWFCTSGCAVLHIRVAQFGITSCHARYTPLSHEDLHGSVSRAKGRSEYRLPRAIDDGPAVSAGKIVYLRPERAGDRGTMPHSRVGGRHSIPPPRSPRGADAYTTVHSLRRAESTQIYQRRDQLSSTAQWHPSLPQCPAGGPCRLETG